MLNDVALAQKSPPPFPKVKKKTTARVNQPIPSVITLIDHFYKINWPAFSLRDACVWHTYCSYLSGAERGLEGVRRSLRCFFRWCGGEAPQGTVRQEFEESFVSIRDMGRPTGELCYMKK